MGLPNRPPWWSEEDKQHLRAATRAKRISSTGGQRPGRRGSSSPEGSGQGEEDQHRRAAARAKRGSTGGQRPAILSQGEGRSHSVMHVMARAPGSNPVGIAFIAQHTSRTPAREKGTVTRSVRPAVLRAP